MRFHEITSITGKGGLFKMGVQRPDGMIVTSLAEGWTKFVSNRNHMFTPLRDIAIYTDTDTVPLLEVMLIMYKRREEIDLPEESSEELRAYMDKILPEYDKDRVYVSDLKKLVRWYSVLDKHDVLSTEAEKAAEETSEEVEEVEEGASD